MFRLRWIRVPALAVALALAATACGGGESEGATTTVAPAGDGDTATTTTVADTTTTTGVSVSGDGDSTWCRELRTVAEENESAGSLNMMTATPEELGEAFNAALTAFRGAADSAPSEIKGDVDVLVEAYATFVEKGNEAEWNLLAMGNDPEFQAAFEDPALEEAGNRIEAYGRDVCGVDITALADVSGSASPPPGGDVDADDPVSIVLGALQIPRALFTDEQIACVTEELGEEFVSSVTPDWVPTPEALEALLAAVEACGITLG